MKKNTIRISLVLSSLFIVGLLLLAFKNTEKASTGEPEKQSHTQVNSISPNYKIGSPEIAKNLQFAGEAIPLDRKDVLEKLERELLVNTYWQSATLLLIKRSKRIFEIVEPILKAEGIPDDFKYLAVAESALVENAVSSSGARGIWQFMRGTARKYGLETNMYIEERYNIEKATKAACKYLKNSYQKTGSWALAAAAYNRGLNGILSDMKKQHVKSYYDLYLNRETGRYVYRIIALKEILKQPEVFGFQVGEQEYYQYPSHYKVSVDTTINDLPLFAQKHGVNYLDLRNLNPWLISYTLPNKSRKKYEIKIPYLEAELMQENKGKD